MHSKLSAIFQHALNDKIQEIKLICLLKRILMWINCAL